MSGFDARWWWSCNWNQIGSPVHAMRLCQMDWCRGRHTRHLKNSFHCSFHHLQSTCIYVQPSEAFDRSLHPEHWLPLQSKQSHAKLMPSQAMHLWAQSSSRSSKPPDSWYPKSFNNSGWFDLSSFSWFRISSRCQKQTTPSTQVTWTFASQQKSVSQRHAASCRRSKARARPKELQFAHGVVAAAFFDLFVFFCVKNVQKHAANLLSLKIICSWNEATNCAHFQCKLSCF